MSDWTMIRRIAWKDFRRIGGLWVALLAFWLICFAYTTYFILQRRNFTVPWSLSEIGIGFLVTAVVYALGWASITFAAEHDDKTYSYLQSLPLSGRNVFWGKLLFGLLSTLLLLVVLAAMGGIHTALLKLRDGIFGGTLDANAALASLIMAGLMIPVAMWVGMIWSMRLKRPLVALCASSVSLAVVTMLAIIAISSIAYEGGPIGMAGAVAVIVAVNLLYFVAYKLSANWLPANRELALPVPKQQSQSTIRRLGWLHRKQITLTCLSVVILALPLAWLTAIGSRNDTPWFAACCLSGLAGLLGVITFLADKQENRFRFLAQLGVPSSTYWLSTLFLPFLAAATIAGILAACAADFLHDGGIAIFCLVLLTFSLGQFYSLACRSSIVACALTLVTAILTCSFLLFCTQLLLPAWATWLPAIGLPLLATYLRVPRWFRETGSWKQWLIPAMPMAALFIAMPLSLICYRIYEIPAAQVSNDIALVRTPSAALQAKALQYKELFAELPSITRLHNEDRNPRLQMYLNCDELRDFHDDALLSRLEDLSAGDGFLPLHEQHVTKLDPACTAAALFLNKAEEYETADNAAQAWSKYKAALQIAAHRGNVLSKELIDESHVEYSIERDVYSRLISWAMLKSNTPQQIEAAAEFINHYRLEQPTWREEVYRIYQYTKGQLPTHYRHFTTFAPWELVRAQRLQDYSCASLYTFFSKNQHLESSAKSTFAEDHSRLSQRFFMNTLTSFYPDGTEAIPYGQIEHARRGIIYQLAAIAYHLRNDAYPSDFSSVTLGDKQLPDDFYVPGEPLVLRGDAIVSGKSGENIYRGSNEFGSKQAFLLPDFKNWTVHESGVASYRRRLNLNDYFQEMPPVDPFVVPPISEPASPAEWGLDRFSNIGEDTPETNLSLQVVKKILKSVDGETRLQILEELRGTDFSQAVFLLPELKEILNNGSPEERSAVSRLIRTTLNGGFSEFEAFKNLLSSHSDGFEFGVPVKNPANGHYYEVLHAPDSLVDRPDSGSWKAAVSVPQEWTFQGMKGHLVTITSKEESDFLIAAFADEPWHGQTAWIGGLYDSDDGEWKWATGPEKSETFWKAGNESVGFSNWGKAPDAEEREKLERDGVHWLTERGSLGIGKWQNVPLQQPNGEVDDDSHSTLIIEYSPEASNAMPSVIQEAEEESTELPVEEPPAKIAPAVEQTNNENNEPEEATESSQPARDAESRAFDPSFDD